MRHRLYQERLNDVSRVTLHLFFVQVTLAAFLGLLTSEFRSTFVLCLFAQAVLQALGAITSRRPIEGGLNEWDGVIWLATTGLVAHAL